MSYYVFHAAPHKRARVHDGSRVHCRDGRGHANQQTSGSGATGWSRPFETLAQAESYMSYRFSHFTDKGKCKVCIPRDPD